MVRARLWLREICGKAPDTLFVCFGFLFSHLVPLLKGNCLPLTCSLRLAIQRSSPDSYRDKSAVLLSESPPAWPRKYSGRMSAGCDHKVGTSSIAPES